jgi:glutamyl-tRNA reductase
LNGKRIKSDTNEPCCQYTNVLETCNRIEFYLYAKKSFDCNRFLAELIGKVRTIVAEFTNKFAKWYDSLNLVPVISRLTQKGLELAHSEARRYAKDFGQGNSDKLKLFAESLVKKIPHGPISFVKDGGDEELSTEQLQAADLINKMFLSQDDDSDAESQQ